MTGGVTNTPKLRPTVAAPAAEPTELPRGMVTGSSTVLDVSDCAGSLPRLTGVLDPRLRRICAAAGLQTDLRVQGYLEGLSRYGDSKRDRKAIRPQMLALFRAAAEQNVVTMKELTALAYLIDHLLPGTRKPHLEFAALGGETAMSKLRLYGATASTAFGHFLEGSPPLLSTGIPTVDANDKNALTASAWIRDVDDCVNSRESSPEMNRALYLLTLGQKVSFFPPLG